MLMIGLLLSTALWLNAADRMHPGRASVTKEPSPITDTQASSSLSTQLQALTTDLKACHQRLIDPRQGALTLWHHNHPGESPLEAYHGQPVPALLKGDQSDLIAQLKSIGVVLRILVSTVKQLIQDNQQRAVISNAPWAHYFTTALRKADQAIQAHRPIQTAQDAPNPCDREQANLEELPHRQPRDGQPIVWDSLIQAYVASLRHATTPTQQQAITSLVLSVFKKTLRQGLVSDACALHDAMVMHATTHSQQHRINVNTLITPAQRTGIQDHAVSFLQDHAQTMDLKEAHTLYAHLLRSWKAVEVWEGQWRIAFCDAPEEDRARTGQRIAHDVHLTPDQQNKTHDAMIAIMHRALMADAFLNLPLWKEVYRVLCPGLAFPQQRQLCGNSIDVMYACLHTIKDHIRRASNIGWNMRIEQTIANNLSVLSTLYQALQVNLDTPELMRANLVMRDTVKTIHGMHRVVAFPRTKEIEFYQIFRDHLTQEQKEQLEGQIPTLVPGFAQRQAEHTQRVFEENLRRERAEEQAKRENNHYKVLGLEKNATQDQIKRAYRALAVQYHPDKNIDKTDPEKAKAASQFRAITEAYTCLMDPDQKRRYDAWLGGA